MRRVILEAAQIQNLIDLKSIENRELEYKGAPPTELDDFLHDVIAMANGAGGSIIYGIAEKRAKGNKFGHADSVNPIDSSSVATIIERLQNWLNSSVTPKAPGIRIYPVTLEAGIVLVVTVPVSWAGPHMAKTTRRIYVRTNSGNDLMDYEQLRSAFLESESAEQKLRDFRFGRISRHMAGESPIRLQPRLFSALWHIVPLRALTRSPRRINLRDDAAIGYFRPPCASGWNDRFNLDGLVVYDPAKEAAAKSYVQAFWTGAVETVCIDFMRDEDAIHGLLLEELLKESLKLTLKAYEALDVPFPLSVMLTLTGVKNLKMRIEIDGETLSGPFDRDVIALPEVLFEEREQLDFVCELLGDALWQAGGFRERPLKSRR